MKRPVAPPEKKLRHHHLWSSQPSWKYIKATCWFYVHAQGVGATYHLQRTHLVASQGPSQWQRHEGDMGYKIVIKHLTRGSTWQFFKHAQLFSGRKYFHVPAADPCDECIILNCPMLILLALDELIFTGITPPRARSLLDTIPLYRYEAAHDEEKAKRQNEDPEHGVDLVSPDTVVDVVQLYIDSAERQEARHEHMCSITPVPRDVLGNLHGLRYMPKTKHGGRAYSRLACRSCLTIDHVFSGTQSTVPIGAISNDQPLFPTLPNVPQNISLILSTSTLACEA